MYASKVPFTRDGSKGPKAVSAKAKKSAAPKPVVEEAAKIEVEAQSIDLITEPQAEEIAEEITHGND